MNDARGNGVLAALVFLLAGACDAGEATGADGQGAMRRDDKERPTKPIVGPLVPTPGSGEGLASTTNSIETVIADMRDRNDLRLAGIPSTFGWAEGTGQVVMGNDPRGSRTPTWWAPANSSYKSDAYWTEILPWMVIFDGEGNAASNTRVEMRGLETWVKSKATGSWVLLDETSTIDGWDYAKPTVNAEATRPDSQAIGGATSVKPPDTSRQFHGWGAMKTINPPDVGAVFITMQARLTVNNPASGDDRAKAKYLLQVGGDYYPDRETRTPAFAPSSYNPGLGLARSKLIANEWRSFSFTTLNVGYQDPGGAAISEVELRAAPPPLK
jgi:hypothetical protein